MNFCLLTILLLFISQTSSATYNLAPDMIEADIDKLYTCHYFPTQFKLRLKVGLLAATYNKTVSELFPGFLILYVQLKGYNLERKATQLHFNNQVFHSYSNLYSRFGFTVPSDDIWEMTFVSDGTTKLQNTIPFEIHIHFNGFNSLTGTYKKVPSILPLTIESYSLDKTNALSLACLNLEFSHSCDFINPGTEVQFTSKSYNSESEAVVSVFSKQATPVCKYVEILYNTNTLHCNVIKWGPYPLLNSRFRIINAFLNNTDKEHINLQVCNALMPKLNETLNVKVALTSIYELSSSEIQITSTDPIDLDIDAKRFDNVTEGTPFNLNIDFSVDAFVVEEVDYSLIIGFPVAFHAIGNISIEFSNYLTNERHLFTNLELSSDGKLMLQLSQEKMNYFKGFGIRIFNFDTPAYIGEHSFEFQIVKQEQTPVTLPKEILVTVGELLDDLIIVLDDDYPMKATEATILARLPDASTITSGKDILIHLGAAILPQEDSVIEVLAIDNINYDESVYDPDNNTIKLNNAIWTQNTNETLTSKIRIKHIKTSGAQTQNLFIQADVLSNAIAIWSQQYFFDLERIALILMGALSNYPHYLELNTEFKFLRKIEFSHNLRISLPNDLNEGTVQVYIEDSNPYLPYAGYSEFNNIIVYHDEETNKQYILIPNGLNGLTKNNPYRLRIRLDQPDMNYTNVTINLDVIPDDHNYDISDSNKILSNTLTTDISIGCPPGCLHCDLNNGVASLCFSCVQGYYKQSNGQCVLIEANSMGFFFYLSNNTSLSNNSDQKNKNNNFNIENFGAIIILLVGLSVIILKNLENADSFTFNYRIMYIVRGIATFMTLCIILLKYQHIMLNSTGMYVLDAILFYFQFFLIYIAIFKDVNLIVYIKKLNPRKFVRFILLLAKTFSSRYKSLMFLILISKIYVTHVSSLNSLLKVSKPFYYLQDVFFSVVCIAIMILHRPLKSYHQIQREQIEMLNSHEYTERIAKLTAIERINKGSCN